ncbi:MAG: amino acid decarboxylase [Blastocatellia bacterium]|nr:MAG: amino acid decarboxylase [Blastocatellia bacterium]
MIDMPPEQFRRLGYRAVDLLTDHFKSLANGPCRRPVPDVLRRELIDQPFPEKPGDADQLLEYIGDTIFRYPMGNGSPRFFGWVNSSVAPIATLAELLAAGLNPSVAGGDHSATYLEHAVLTWVKRMLNFPQTGGAILTSGGSVANLIGLAVMRHVKTSGDVRARGLAGEAKLPIVYTSQEGHSCIEKAMEILGLGHDNLRRVPVTSDWRIDVRALAASIETDRGTGLMPACVAATAGTVNTGAIDALDEIADLCADQQLWFHVDAAFGGPAALVPELADSYRGLERADSVAVDPHKWMYVPVECGCALVRDANAMRDAFSLVPPYLRDDTGLPWFSEFGIQQTRGFRALKLWLVLKHVGIDGLRQLVANNIALARSLQSRLQTTPNFELLAGGPLSVTCFRYCPPPLKGQDAELNRLNRSVLDAVQRAGEVFLTGTELAGRFALRACIVNFRTTEDDLTALLEAILSAGRTAYV